MHGLKSEKWCPGCGRSLGFKEEHLVKYCVECQIKKTQQRRQMKIEKKENGHIIGLIKFYLADGENPTMIDSVEVDENHRRKRIARDLMTEACDKLRELGEDTVVIVAAYDTPIGIENLVKFYEDLGFSRGDYPGSNVIMEMDLRKEEIEFIRASRIINSKFNPTDENWKRLESAEKTIKSKGKEK